LPYIFVSYSHADGKLVFPAIAKLQDHGFRLWFDKGVPPSAEWEAELDRRVKCSRVVVMFLSARSARSYNVLREVRMVLDAKKDAKKDAGQEVITVCLGSEIPRIPDVRVQAYIEAHQAIVGFHKDPAQAVNSLSDALERFRETRTSPEEEDLRALCLLDGPDGSVSSYLGNQTPYMIDDVFTLTSGGAIEALRARYCRVEEPTRPISKAQLQPGQLTTRPISIRKAFVAPLYLLSGLITRLNDAWPPMVRAYTALSAKKDGELDDLHYFFEFCWLAWGPSVSTRYLIEDPAPELIALQAALGDESNSLPLVMRKKTWPDFLDQIRSAGMEPWSPGWPVRLNSIAVMHPEDPFLKPLLDLAEFRGRMDDSVVLYFAGKNDRGMAPSRVDATGEAGNGGVAHYSTAYLWLMLEQISPTEGASVLEAPEPGLCAVPRRLEPGRVLPFFEHANLAGGKALEFLVGCLARKAVHHALECEDRPDYRETGYYRYAASIFDDLIRAALERETLRLPAPYRRIVRKRLQVGSGPSRSTAEVVEFVDRLFDVITTAGSH